MNVMNIDLFFKKDYGSSLLEISNQSQNNFQFLKRNNIEMALLQESNYDLSGLITNLKLCCFTPLFG